MVAELRGSDLTLVDVRLTEWFNGGNGMLSPLEAYHRFAQRWVPATTAVSPTGRI